MATHNTDVQDEERTDEEAKGGSNPHAIARISVDGLFGQFDYDLSAREGSADLSRLFIMYGENGAGKTTLLKMVYHALSSERGGGHRTFLAQTRFDRFSIELNNGTILETDRRVKPSGGSLLLTLRNKEKIIAGVELKVDEALSIPTQNDIDEERFQELIRAIGELDIKVHYLSDDRKHQGELQERNRHRAATNTWTSADYLANIVSTRHLSLEDVGKYITTHTNENALEEVMARVVTWVQHQVRRGATKGQGNVYEIYSKVISDIAHSGETNWDNVAKEAKVMIGTLQQLEETSRQYSVYGLTPPFPRGAVD